MSKRRKASLCLAVASMALPALARQDGAGPEIKRMQQPAVLRLSDAQRMAVERNWDFLAARADVDIATAQKLSAAQWPNPVLSLSTEQISVDDHPNSTPSGNGAWDRSYDTKVNLGQTVEIGGKRKYRKAAADAGVQGARARLEDARRQLHQAVTRAYIDALLAETSYSILTNSARSLRQEAQIAEARLNAGDISRTDKAQIEIAAERLELQAEAARATAEAARISVEILLGEPHPSGTWAPGDSLDSLAAESTAAPEATPGVSRPDLLAARSAEQRAAAELRYQRALRVPDPTLFIQYEHEPPDLPNTIGLGVSFPLPLWNRNQGGINAARGALSQAQLQASKVQAQIQSDIAIARLAYLNAADRWERHRRELQPKSESTRQTVSFAYERGGASLLDLLSAQRTDNEIRLATAQAAADKAKAAADLRAALNLNR